MFSINRTGQIFITLAVTTSSLCLSFMTGEECKQQNPCSRFILQKEGFSVGYDGRLKQAAWVYEELTKGSLDGNTDRNQCKFSPDSDIPEVVRSLLSDYKNCGYDRGHLTPAANHVSDEMGMADTFLLSNVSPQSPSCNRWYWL